MPLIRRWRRIGFTTQLVILCSFLLVVVGALVVGIAALLVANSTGSCVNNVLGTRNFVGTPDRVITAQLNKVAHLQHRHLRPLDAPVSDNDANRAVYSLFIAPAGRKSALVLIRHAYGVQDANQAFRDDHPLGRC